MVRKMSVWFATAALALGLCSAAMAAVPTVIPFQGRLTDAAGTPLNASQSIRFSLWDAATAGNEKWFEVQPAVTVANGMFSVDLGSVTALPAGIFTGGDLYLEIKVGTDAAMTPRQRLGSVAYAQAGGSTSAVGNAFTFSYFTPRTGKEDLLTYTATFPRAGYAIVTATVDGSTSGASTNPAGYQIAISDSSQEIGWSGSMQMFLIPSGTGQTMIPMCTQRIFQVSAGVKTFYLVGNVYAGTCGTYGMNMTVLFVPDSVGAIQLLQNAPVSLTKDPSAAGTAR